MVGIKNLSLASFLWLGLASRGLALGIDEATNDLTLVERSEVDEVFTRDFDDELYERDFDEELDERDFDEELDERDFEDELLYERDFDDELDERDFGDFELPLQVRGGASINFKERVLTGPKNTVNKQPARVDMKAYEERTRKHISGPAPYRRGLHARGAASINFKERVLTGPKNTVNKQPARVDMKAYEERTRKHISGPAPYRRGLATINLKEKTITGIKKNRPIPKPPVEVDTKAYFEKLYGKKLG